MKDSGIVWIGQIPSDWDLIKVKYCADITNGSDPKTEGDIPVYGSGAGSFRTCGEYKVGPTVLIGRKGATLHIPHYIQGRYWNVDTAFDVKTKPGYDLKWFYYLAGCFDYKFYISQTTLPSMTQSCYENMIVPNPPLVEQQRIAVFLDEKCGEIDSIRSDIQKQIDILNDYKKSVITEAVTKGLNPKAKLKDSGIEWIGKIPEGWNVKKLKFYFNFGKGLPITKENLQDTGVPVISYGQIHSKQNSGTAINDTLIRFVNESYLRTNPSSLVHQNDFIFADTSEDLDGCGNCVYVDTKEPLFAGYHAIIFRSLQPNAKYFAYLFLTDCWRSQIRKVASGVKLYSITQKILKETSVIIPPLSEQKAIADYLDEKCSEIDATIADKQKQLETLDEYKKSLIFEYVTGKKEVPA